ncbi:MAG: MMPL family transporter [Candidatus Micrarchaeia archaeon]
MEKNLKRTFIHKYSLFVSSKYWLVFSLVMLLSFFALIAMMGLETKSMEYSDMIPDDLEVFQTMELISSGFGGTSSVIIALQIEPEYIEDEIVDIRDYRVIQQIDLLSEIMSGADNVLDVSSPASYLKTLNGGELPKTDYKIKKLISENPEIFESYISSDYSLAVINIRVSDSFDPNQMIDDFNMALLEIPNMRGLKITLTGDTIASAIVQEEITPDITKTSIVSFIGIILISFLLFRSIKFGLTPLGTILIGIVWTMGFVSVFGMSLSSMTSGAISMIMGIGIDFGIQISSRYKYEKKNSVSVENAMEKTLNATLIPIFITTLAAIIGFQAMSLGQLKILGELGTIMSYGVVMCSLAAITFVPSMIIIFEKHSLKNYIKSYFK